jgi:hypothetical protein
VREGLSYFDIAPTDAQLEDLPHVFLTSDAPWDPTVIDSEFHDTEFHDYVVASIPEAAERRDAYGIRQPTATQTTLVNYYDALRDTHEDDHEDPIELSADMQAQMNYYDSLRNATPSTVPLDYDQQLDDAFDAAVLAELRKDEEEDRLEEFTQTIAIKHYLRTFYADQYWDYNEGFPPSPLPVDHRVPITRVERMVNAMIACPQHMKCRLPDAESLKPNFGWVDVKRIQSTLDHTTQYYRAAIHYPFRKHFKTRFPAANFNRLLEWYATDTVGGDGLKGHGGCTMYQLFLDLQSEFCQGYRMSVKSEFPSTLVDFIHVATVPCKASSVTAPRSKPPSKLMTSYVYIVSRTDSRNRISNTRTLPNARFRTSNV